MGLIAERMRAGKSVRTRWFFAAGARRERYGKTAASLDGDEFRAGRA